MKLRYFLQGPERGRRDGRSLDGGHRNAHISIIKRKSYLFIIEQRVKLERRPNINQSPLLADKKRGAELKSGRYGFDI